MPSPSPSVPRHAELVVALKAVGSNSSLALGGCMPQTRLTNTPGARLFISSSLTVILLLAVQGTGTRLVLL